MKYLSYLKLHICNTGQTCLLNVAPIQTYPYSVIYQFFSINFFNHHFWIKNKKMVAQEKSKRILKFYSKFKY